MPPKETKKKQVKKEIQAFAASEFKAYTVGNIYPPHEIPVLNEETIYYRSKGEKDDNKVQELIIREKSTGKIFQGRKAWFILGLHHMDKKESFTGPYDLYEQYDIFVNTPLQQDDKIMKKKTAKPRQSKAREQAIKAWEDAKQKIPKIFHTNLNGPATDRMLNEVEKKFNCKLPEEAREIMKVHNGRRGKSYCDHEIFHPFFMLSPVEEWADFFTTDRFECPELEDMIEEGDEEFVEATKGRSLLAIGTSGEYDSMHLNTTTGKVWRFIVNSPEFSLEADSLSEYIANATIDDHRLDDDLEEIEANKSTNGVSKFYTETKEFRSEGDDDDEDDASDSDYVSTDDDNEDQAEESKIKEEESESDAEPKAKRGKQTKKAKEESEEENEDEEEEEEEEEEEKPRGKKAAKKAAAKKAAPKKATSKKRKDESEEEDKEEEEEEEEEKPKKQTKGKKPATKKVASKKSKDESEEDEEEEEEKPKKQAKGKKAAPAKKAGGAKKRKDESEDDEEEEEEEEEEEDTQAKKKQKKNGAESSYKVHTVNKDTTIPDFASSQKISGNSKILYKATKAEEISASKSVLVHDTDSNKWLEGASARKLLGISTEDKGKVYPRKWPNHEIFIQSTSTNRKVGKGDKLIFL